VGLVEAREGHDPSRLDLQAALAVSRERGWPLVMGVVNVTPDSFSDGGRFLRPERAVDHALALVQGGADLLDVGGESTRPGSSGVTASEELGRVLPVLEGIRARCAVPVSVDTSKPEVMTEAARAGASVINDVCALRAPGAMEAAAETGLPVVLMHMQGEPRTMQDDPRYGDVVGEVTRFLLHRADRCCAAGIARERIVLDPGFGFGKTLAHNLELLRGLGVLARHGYPVLVGLSRKSMIEKLIGRPVMERVHASISLALAAAGRGAALLRVHDVAATVDALRVAAAVDRFASPAGS
jgi:dihydropteroate synthase